MDITITPINTRIMKKFLYFFGIAAYALGAIGGFGYAMYSHAYLIGICVVILAVMAFPTLKKFYLKLTE